MCQRKRQRWITLPDGLVHPARIGGKLSALPCRRAARHTAFGAADQGRWPSELLPVVLLTVPGPLPSPDRRWILSRPGFSQGVPEGRALIRWGFNTKQRSDPPDEIARVLAWVARNSAAS
jgi:hypothetical protein